MPRRARIAPGEIVYPALNRANGGSELFHKPEGYSAFERIMISAMQPHPTAGVRPDAQFIGTWFCGEARQ